MSLSVLGESAALYLLPIIAQKRDRSGEDSRAGKSKRIREDAGGGHADSEGTDTEKAVALKDLKPKKSGDRRDSGARKRTKKPRKNGGKEERSTNENVSAFLDTL